MEHRLRLNVQKADQFWCPINNFALAPGFRLEGTLPLGVNLKYIRMGVAAGKLIDVNGTVLGGVKKGDDKREHAAFTGQGQDQEEQRSSNVQEGNVKPASTESGDSDTAQDEPSAQVEDDKEKVEVKEPPAEPKEDKTEDKKDVKKDVKKDTGKAKGGKKDK